MIINGFIGKWYVDISGYFIGGKQVVGEIYRKY